MGQRKITTYGDPIKLKISVSGDPGEAAPLVRILSTKGKCQLTICRVRLTNIHICGSMVAQ